MSTGPERTDPVEQAIADAIRRGEFDDLPGAGKPLELGDNDPAWWARRKLAEMQQLDQALEAADELYRQLDALWTLPSEAAVVTEVSQLNRRIEAVNHTRPEGEKISEIDPAAAVRTWHRMHRIRH